MRFRLKIMIFGCGHWDHSVFMPFPKIFIFTASMKDP